MTTRTGSHSGNALTPHDILRNDVLRHARAAYRQAMARVPATEAREHLTLAAASTPAARDDDQDKAALWQPSGAGAAATADKTERAAIMFTDGQATGVASSTTHDTAVSISATAKASAAAGTTGAVGTTAATGSALLGPGILGAFAVAAGANLNDSGRLHDLSARSRLSSGHGNGNREDGATGTVIHSPTDAGNRDGGATGTGDPQPDTTTAISSTDTTLLATGTGPTAPSRPTNDDGTQAGTSGTPAAADAATAPAAPAALAESAESATPAALATSTTDAPKPTDGGNSDTTPQVKPLPTYSENASVSYAHSESKTLGAAIFNGSSEETAPAFVRITAIQGKDGEAAAGTMSLQDGDALTAGSIVARADFDKVVWDASKNEGGSFRFIPVQDAQGTTLPGAVEQTVTIQEAPALPTYEADMSVAYSYDQSKAVGAGIFNGTDSTSAPAFVRITAIQGKDGEAAAGTMSLQGGDALTAGSVVARADFDKVVWDASKNEGGSFRFIPVQDAQGTTLPGASEQTVTIAEAKPLFHIAAEYFDPMQEHPAYVKVTNITESNDTNGILDALVIGEDGGTVLKEGEIIRAEDFGRVYWNYASNEGGEIKLTPYNADDRMVDPGPYEMELEPSWKPARKSLPIPHDAQGATDSSQELAGPIMDDPMPLAAQVQYPGMTPLSMGSVTLLDSLLEQHPGTAGLL